ncbi:MAG TPA: MMPL family transporter [Nocardioidaceae bacterium]|nr:MMPL family transporter [Nocardioidaceae bacterium]
MAPPAPVAAAGRRRLPAAYATWIVRLRWWVIAFWALATFASVAVLPTLSETGGSGDLRGLLPDDTQAVQTEIRSVEIFGFPLLGRTTLVQRDPDGLSVYAQARTAVHAAAVSRGEYDDVEPILGALPLSNVFGLFPASRERNTTALTYLFFAPGESFTSQAEAAREYADRFFTERDHVVGVTGSVPARAQQYRIIQDALPALELTTLAAIVLIVGLNFRSVVAPAVTLVTVGVGYVLTLRLSGLVAELFDVTSPSELEPVVVALLLGVVTDYVVFFCSALRHELVAGAGRLQAARGATAQFAPIIGVAGLAVAGGTASLAVAESTFFRALGPALVFTVLIALVVAITLVPAVMAVLGRFVFWPVRPRRAGRHVAVEGSAAVRRFSVVSRIAHSRKTAGLVVAGCSTGLLLAAVPLLRLDLGVSFVGSLPPGGSVREAASAAKAGFADGILSPSVVLVEGENIASEREELRRLGELLEDQPGVAGVLGPGDQPLRIENGILLATDDSAARYLVVLEDEPLGAAAIDTVDRLDSRLSELVARSGLTDVTAGLAGDSATAAFIVEQTEQDLVRIAVAAFAVNLVMLVLFLRAVVAALYLLVASVLSLGASLGLTTLVFNQLNPGEGLTFYVPFAAAVLLLAFGSDYNIFGVGHVWDEARHRRLSDAVSIAMPRTTRAITAAGLALAASFGLLALVPLQPFRQLAFAMGLGILLDVVVVRSLLMPALLTVFGSVSAWPSKLLRRPEPASEAATPDA